VLVHAFDLIEEKTIIPFILYCTVFASIHYYKTSTIAPTIIKSPPPLPNIYLFTSTFYSPTRQTRSPVPQHPSTPPITPQNPYPFFPSARPSQIKTILEIKREERSGKI